MTCELENFSSKGNASNSLMIEEEINGNADENIFSDLINSQIPPPNTAENIN